MSDRELAEAWRAATVAANREAVMYLRRALAAEKALARVQELAAEWPGLAEVLERALSGEMEIQEEMYRLAGPGPYSPSQAEAIRAMAVLRLGRN